jgi:hypothetical protein
VISREQLTDALQRLDPRERELLSLSLWRRVPDEALGRIYDCQPGEIARRRATAIEHLADELEVQRGEDLGAVLKALLEPETWATTEAIPGEDFGAGPGPAYAGGVPRDDGPAETAAEDAGTEPGPIELEPLAKPGPREQGTADPDVVTPVDQAETAPEPVPDAAPDESEPARPGPAGAAAPTVQTPVEPELAPAAAPVPAPPGAGQNGDGGESLAAPDEPVLEMLAGRERASEVRGTRPGSVALAATSIAALLGGAAFVGATQFGDGGSGADRKPGDGDTTRRFVPAEAGPLQAPFASDPRTSSCYSTAFVSQSTVLYRQPGGRPRLRLTARTEWRSPRVLGVVSQRGDWLGVQAPELRNGEVGWIPRARARVDCVRWSLHADLSERRLYVRRDGRTVRKMGIAIGSPSNPTPLGRFSVTDKLEVSDPGSPYGCCVLALTGHQTRLPPDWPGGDRLAVHATTDLSTIGEAVSLGCMRAPSGHARWLIETIPLGAPIFVRS